MKKSIILFFYLLFSSQVFAQENNGLENKIVKQWMEYSKAFEYKDYERISNHFTYPAIFNNANPIVVKDKKTMVRNYKTVRENLQLGFNQYSDEDILEISKVAGLDDFISKVPNGYDLQLREKGAGLSGGQRQTIALARSLLHKPPVLVLDEPTSAMDTGTEKLVINRLSITIIL